MMGVEISTEFNRFIALPQIQRNVVIKI